MTDETMERKTLLGFIASMGLLILVSAVAILAVRGYGNSNRWFVPYARGDRRARGTRRFAGPKRSRPARLPGKPVTRSTWKSAMRALSPAAKSSAVGKAAHRRQWRTTSAAAGAGGLLGQRTARIDDLILQAQTEGLPAAQHGPGARQIRQVTVAANAEIEALLAEERRLLASRHGNRRTLGQWTDRDIRRPVADCDRGP